MFLTVAGCQTCFCRRGRYLGLIQPFRELPTTELFFYEGLIELPYHSRFRWFNHHLGGHSRGAWADSGTRNTGYAQGMNSPRRAFSNRPRRVRS